MIGAPAAVPGAGWEARRCIRCGAPAEAVLAGQEAAWEVVALVTPGGGVRRRQRLLQGDIRDLNFCLRHAVQASYRTGRRRRC